ncbi:MAG: PAS domain S-box protein [Ferruginibacter sp.]
MRVNKLLETQIKRHLSQSCLKDEKIISFIDAISNTYNLYQEELKPQQALDALDHETEQLTRNPVKNGAANLDNNKIAPEHIALINQIDEASKCIDGENSATVIKEVPLATVIENEPGPSSVTGNMLHHLVANLNNGILLEDENGKVVLANQLFCDSFGITVLPENIIGLSSSEAINLTKHLISDQEGYTKRINSLLKNKKTNAGDELQLSDGTILLRDYVPLFAGNEYKGQLWKFEDVTSARKNQRELQRLALVASANENGVGFSDATGALEWCNEGFSKLTGYSYQEVLGQNALQLCLGPLTDRGGVSQMADSFLAGKSFMLELIHYRKDKTWFWGRIKGQPILDGNGTVDQYFAIIEDITVEKEQEEQLSILSSIAEENLNAVIIMDTEGGINWVNKSFTEHTGYTLEEVKHRKPHEILNGRDTNAETVETLKKAIADGNPFTCTLLNYTKDGGSYWVRIQGQPLRNKQGELIGFFSLDEDITKAIENTRRIEEYESRFRKAFEKIGDNVWEYDFSTGVTYFSNTKSHLLGYEINEFNDNVNLWWERTYDDDKHLLEENDLKYHRGEIDHHILEYRILHNDGSIRWVMERGVVIEKDEQGKILKLIGTHTDITDRKLAEELLQTKEEKYRSIITNMNLGLMEVDTEEKILFSNQSFCDMSGYEFDELIGKRASHIFVKGENIEKMESKNEARKKSGSDAYEIAVKNKRGQLRWWLMSGATRYNESGDLVGSIGIYLDITDQKQLEIDLIEAREQAEESTRSKEVFLANMSHEIRTPMNAILGMAHQLTKTKLDSKQLFYLDTINSASENLLVIINDILDLSKIEAGKLNLENIGFEPKAVISRAMQVLVHKAEEKGLSITNSKFDANLSPVLMGDPYRLNQVLLNLISNAIKFTEKGGVDLSCSVIKETPGTQTIFVEVKDSGIGMDEGFVKNLFEKFSQEDLSVTRQYGGTGLGMSICKDLLSLMGGEIMVESKKGVGTTISFQVELEKGTAADLPAKQNIFINPNMLANRKILIVDDNNMNRLVAKTILNNYGAITSEAVNGKDAVEILRNNVVDIVLMDIQMPIMDGMEATKIIRNEISTTLPMIALTANAIKGDNDKCIAVGLNAYLSKPFKEEDLLKTVAFWLDEGNISFAKPAEVFNQTGGDLYDLSGIRTISRGNEEFVLKMVNMFIEQTPQQVNEMESSYHLSAYNAMGAIAHKLKPNIDNMGIVSLKDAIRQIEKIGKSGVDDNLLPGLLKTVSQTLNKVIETLQQEFEMIVQ